MNLETPIIIKVLSTDALEPSLNTVFLHKGQLTLTDILLILWILIPLSNLIVPLCVKLLIVPEPFAALTCRYFISMIIVRMCKLQMLIQPPPIKVRLATEAIKLKPSLLNLALNILGKIINGLFWVFGLPLVHDTLKLMQELFLNALKTDNLSRRGLRDVVSKVEGALVLLVLSSYVL